MLVRAVIAVILVQSVIQLPAKKTASVITDSPVPPKGYVLSGSLGADAKPIVETRYPEDTDSYQDRSEIGYEGKIYVYSHDWDSMTNAFHVYHLGARSWQKLSASHFFGITHNSSIVGHGDNLYAFGVSAVDSGFAGFIQKYSIADDKWTTMPNPLNEDYYPENFINAQGRLFLVANEGPPSVTKMWEYFPFSNTVQPCPARASAVRESMIVASGSKIYFINGISTLGGYRMESFDIVTQQWDVLPDPPVGDYAGSALAVDETVYIGTPLDGLVTFNTASGTWTLPSLPTPRFSRQAMYWKAPNLIISYNESLYLGEWADYTYGADVLSGCILRMPSTPVWYVHKKI